MSGSDNDYDWSLDEKSKRTHVRSNLGFEVISEKDERAEDHSYIKTNTEDGGGSQ